MTSTLPAFVDVVFPASVASVLTYRSPRPGATWRRQGSACWRRSGGGPSPDTSWRCATARRWRTSRSLCEILDAEPLLDAHLLALTRWVADYYMCPWGEVIRTALPPGIDTLIRRVVRLTSAGQVALDGDGVLRPGERDLLAPGGRRGSVPITTLTRRWPNAPALVHLLARRGLLAEPPDLRPAACSAAVRRLLRLGARRGPRRRLRLPSRAVKQRAILRAAGRRPGGSAASGGRARGTPPPSPR